MAGLIDLTADSQPHEGSPRALPHGAAECIDLTDSQDVVEGAHACPDDACPDAHASTLQLRRKVLAMPCCAALDARTRAAVERAAKPMLELVLWRQLEVHELPAQLEHLANLEVIAALTRENERDEASRQAAVALQAEFDAFYKDEEEELLQDERDNAEDLAQLKKALYFFSIGNDAWEREAPPLAADASRLPPPDFVQLIRAPGSGVAVPSVTWRCEAAAWRAQQRPATERPYLQVAFISDMHGAHGMLDKYMHAPEIAEADCLCICGDCFEHEEGPTRLDEVRPRPERNLAKWLLSQPQRYKIVVSGNHDACFAESEAEALRGVPPPHAGEPGRRYLRAREAPCLYLQDEAAVITLASGEEVIIYGTPWHPQIGGIFEYNPGTDGDAAGLDRNPSPFRRDRAPRPAPGIVGRKLAGSWGAVGDRAHVVLCHGPPNGILDSVARKAPLKRDMKLMSEQGAQLERRRYLAGEPVGCRFMLQRLRTVRPCVMAFGHVHANQGLRGKEWATSAEGKAWAKQLRQQREGRGAAADEEEPKPAGADEAKPAGATYRRVAWGRDLSDVAAAVWTPEGNRKKLEADLGGTLFVNAACLNATTAGNQHGLRPDEHGHAVLVKTKREQEGGPTYVRDLRPPIVVRVYPGARGERRMPELLKLKSNYRFQEE